MKKILAIVLSVIMVMGMFAACGSNAEKSMTLEKGKLIMSTNAAFPPYEMTTDNGGFEGIDVEIAQAIAKKLNLELEILDMEFDAALLAADKHGFDDFGMDEEF